ncbi:lethal (3) malignant brain tumor isoform X2 [Anticarsia gemmatalis]|uniref:lethal (3) malignant brain tumor isoform X2 n=1 Tax=Anticarsia gemmatalis TaxID=129554 RepID=UPI003F7735FD
MERQQCNSLQNFDEPKTEILKKRLLKSANTSVNANLTQNSAQQNVLLNTLRAPISSSMIVSSMQASQSSLPITHNLVTHSIAPVKIHANNTPYPLQLSTVHVPVQIPGSTSNINVPVQLSGPTNTVPLQIAPVSLPLQVSGTTSVPVQLPAGETINVPLQIPAASQNIQLTGPGLPSMPVLQNPNQSLHSSIIHVHMGSNQRPPNMDATTDMSVSSSSQLQLTDNSVQVKVNNPIPQVQVGHNNAVIQMQNPSNPNSIQLRGAARPVPHVVYIQTPAGLKPVTSTDVITQASTSGNPPQIIVTSNSNLHLISNVNTKPNIAPKNIAPAQNKSSILAPVNTSQPIVIQKPKANDKMMVPVSIAPNNQGKQAIAYLGSMKKPNQKSMAENQSILISNNQPNVNQNNKLFITPVTMPKIQNTKFILPVTLPATMASKGPIINLQIANGQIQNDPQGNITVMRDTGPMDAQDLPPLQPLKMLNGKDIPQSPKGEKSFTISIPGSRAEPTGEQGEYTLSIPETNASMNDDIYTVSIADEDDSREKSFTLAIPEKGKSLLNRNTIDRDLGLRNDMGPVTTIAAPAILRRSNSDNSDRKIANANMKRRISLCAENLSNKSVKLSMPPKVEKIEEPDNSDDHRVPSLFCDEKLDKDLEAKHLDSDMDDYKEHKVEPNTDNKPHEIYFTNLDSFIKTDTVKIEMIEEDPPGLIWNNGVARLQGSNLQFQTNEFGLIDLVDGDQEDVKYHTPMKQRINREKKPNSPEDLYRCECCGCHGMAAEFITPSFCSAACQNEVNKALNKKKDKERVDLMKKKNKMKKLLMKKQLSDSDIMLSEGKDDKVLLKHYDSLPADCQLSEATLLKMSEEAIENEKYPWMCGKNGFSWMRYLDHCKAKAAPVKLFKNPFPYNRNGFKVGMRLEAIDPQHPSLFCVVSVAEVQGYRMRLHFDEYSEQYDYWVNADCVDIFPPGWCEKNGRTLRPPGNISITNFSWPLYLKQMRAVAAPRNLFPHVTSAMFKPNCFRIGMKLEAEDRKNELVCVASIADILDNRMLINFDSWDEMYDFWVEPTSPYIHSVGWAEENGVPLTPPNFYKDPDTFSWENYLAETGASAAPPRAFKTRPPQGFKPGMKLEVVDKRVPFLIRVASITAVKGHQVRVTYDGWPDDLSCWFDDDSPDIHPVGWCLKTGHPLEPPLTDEELRLTGPCGVGGCRGLGSARGGSHKHHASAAACPYRAPPAAPDRLKPRHLHPEHALPRERRVLSKQPKSNSVHTSTPTSDTVKERAPRGRPPKHRRVEEVKHDPSDDESISSGGGKRSSRAHSSSSRALRTYSRLSAPPHAALAALSATPGARPDQLARHLAALALPQDPTIWTEGDVSALVTRIAGADAAAAVAAARLSGAELVMASRDELVHCVRLRLGPAVKVYSAVRHLRAAYS